MHSPEETPLARKSTSATRLLEAYRKRETTPVEILQRSQLRIEECDAALSAMVALLDGPARIQARQAERDWLQGAAGPLAGVPVSIKDTFDVAGCVTTRGSRIHRRNLALEDSGVIRRLRNAGAVFVGKTNTSEFGQSATCENKLGLITRNPWNLGMTPGGSSGGAAVSVAAGYVPIALGADGGGSIRIPAAMTGIFGFKPSYGLCLDEGGFRAMSDFACAGPLSSCVADARIFLSVLAERTFVRSARSRKLRIAYGAAPEGRPVHPGIRAAVDRVAGILMDLGHMVEAVDLKLDGWADSFGPLVLAEEWRERGHLNGCCEDELTDYEAASLVAGSKLSPDHVAQARRCHDAYRARIAGLFNRFDILLTPTTASPAFAIGERPREIDGRQVGRLWGAFPFTCPFNVAGSPAAAIPFGVVDSLPVSAQVVGACGQDASLLDLAEDLEDAIGFDVIASLSQEERELGHG